MNEQQRIQSTQQQVTEIVEHARGVIKGAVVDFLKDIQDAQRMVERANALAHQWNEQAQDLVLPDRFQVTGYLMLNDIKRTVERLDVWTPQGAQSRKPLTAADLEPTRILPSQKRVA